MMILRSAPAPPFGRKVKIAADLLGLHDAIEVVFADTNDPNDSLPTQNPLGKIPVLILDDGSKLFDSRVIVEYLDALAGGRLIPAASTARWRVVTAAALADGMNDAALLIIYEKRFRAAELWSQIWMERQAQKITCALATFAATPPAGIRDISHMGLACALGYLDLRFAGGGAPSIRCWSTCSTPLRPKCRPSKRRASRIRNDSSRPPVTLKG
jgi:glutathione S-transferase